MRKHILTFLLATGASVGSIFAVQPAMANCVVNAGTCGADGYCTVNVGDCNTNGACTVNLGSCRASGACTVNLTTCNGGACTINGGDCNNKAGSLICLNTKCDGGSGDNGKNYAGFSCGFTSDNDDTGVINNNPKKQFGEIDGGPWVVYDTDPMNTVTDVTITCTIQVNADAQGAGGVSRSATTQGNVGEMVDTISYFAQPTDRVYLCTKVEWNSSKGHETVLSDADNDSANGYQCDEAISTE